MKKRRLDNPEPDAKSKRVVKPEPHVSMQSAINHVCIGREWVRDDIKLEGEAVDANGHQLAAQVFVRGPPEIICTADNPSGECSHCPFVVVAPLPEGEEYKKMMQVDEKPIHMNESGSKALKTLEHEGATHVDIRTNHSASRERITIMTSAFSSAELAEACGKPPLEACIKATSNARALAVESVGPADMQQS